MVQSCLLPPPPTRRSADHGRGDEGDGLATELMDRFRRTGSGDAFEQLVRMTAPQLARRVRRRVRGSVLDPDEMLQDTLVNIFRYPARFHPDRPGAFRAWATTIVDNIVRRHLRRARSQAERSTVLTAPELLVEQPDDRGCDPGLAAEHAEQRRTLRRAYALVLHAYLIGFGAISDRERFALDMVEGHGMRYAELGRLLGIRPEAVKMVVFRARRRIEERMRAVLGGKAAV